MSTLFIGLGRMGAPMARRHAERHETILFDVGPAGAALAAELGIASLTSLDEVPVDVDTVILMVPSSRAVEDVLLADDGSHGLLRTLPRGSLVIDMSSSVPKSTQRIAEIAAGLGIDYVDAPVSGGVAKAQTGELAVMMGGTPEAVERARDHIEPLAGAILVVGPSGSGHAAKALNNLLSATNISAVGEVLSVSTTFGIDPGVMVDVINASTGRSQASEVKYPRHILTGAFDSGFAMDLMIKDLGIARDLAEEFELETPITAAATTVARAVRDSLDNAAPDHTELARYYEARNSVSFRATTD